MKKLLLLLLFIMLNAIACYIHIKAFQSDVPVLVCATLPVHLIILFLLFTKYQNNKNEKSI